MTWIIRHKSQVRIGFFALLCQSPDNLERFIDSRGFCEGFHDGVVPFLAVN